MNTKKNPCWIGLILAAVVALLTRTSLVLAEATTAQQALEVTPLKQGVCVVLDRLGTPGTGVELGLALAKPTQFIVLVQVDGEEAILRGRAAASAAGLLNQRVYVEKIVGRHFALVQHAADLVVAADLSDDTLSTLPASELVRVLSPNGHAVVGRSASSKAGPLTAATLEKWLAGSGATGIKVAQNDAGLWAQFSKPLPSGVDDWTHWYHGPDNNTVSRDTVLKYPYLIQWLGKPYYGAQPRTVVVAAGRMFSATGSAARTADQPDRWNDQSLLTAQNIYNGQIYWQRKLPADYQTGRSAFVATADMFYMLQDNGALCLDPVTGKELKAIYIEGLPDQGKWMAVVEDVLLVLTGPKDPNPADIKYVLKDKYPIPPRRGDQRFWGAGRALGAYDLKTGKTLWVHREDKDIDSRAMGAGGGRVYFAGDGGMGCLEIKTGRPVWRNTTDEVVQGLTQLTPGYTPKADQNNSLGELRAASLVTSNIVYVRIQGMKDLLALAVTDGKLLWKQTASSGRNTQTHLFFDEGKLNLKSSWVDPQTGKDAGKFNANQFGCGPINVSPNGYYSRHGIAFDRISSQAISDHSFRSGCWQDSLPVNGVLVSTPYTCVCSYSLKGFIVQAPAGDFRFGQAARESERLEARENLAKVAPLAVEEKDWPTYRGNNQRTGCSKAMSPAKGAVRWEYKPAVASMPTQPVSAGGLIFFATDAGKVVALDAADGKVKWEYFTGGKIVASPTVWNGRVFVGSFDGYAYALEATSGRLLWRFQAAPASRQIMMYGHLASTWPAATGVLVENGTAFVGAGIIDYDGTHIYALDAITGAIKWQNNDSSMIIDKVSRKGASIQDWLATAKGTLWLASGNAVSPAGYRMADGQTVTSLYFTRSANDRGIRRGMEIGIFQNNYFIHGGELFHASYLATHGMQQRDADFFFGFARFNSKGDVVHPETLLTAGIIPPVWDAEIFVGAETGYNNLECLDVSKMVAFLNSQTPDPDKGTPKGLTKIDKLRSFLSALPDAKTNKVSPYRQWVTPTSLYGMALTSNAVLMAHGDMKKSDRTSPASVQNWRLSAVNRADGKILWSCALSAEPTFSSVSVDREGNAIVALRNGAIVSAGAGGK